MTPGVNAQRHGQQNRSGLPSSNVKMRSANSFAGSGPSCCANARIGRHEGGIERALGKDRPEMIGKTQRDEEGIGPQARRRGSLPA